MRVTETDARHMRRALELAEAGWGRVHPNPLVGAVVVQGARVVGEGAHREYGGAHAEVEALEAAADEARGATLYVTLEPCSHHGKTPPCTDAVVRAGVRRVVFATRDPHPEAAGGAARLEEAGVEVTVGVEAERADQQNALFLHPIRTGRAFVALKFGMSVDARIARSDGQQTRVTGPEAEARVHRLRGGFDAILVGARTARIDDPLLTVREAPEPRRPPVRVVADPEARLSQESRLARTANEVPVRVLVSRDAASHEDVRQRMAALQDQGIEVLEVEDGPGGLDPGAALDRLFELGTRTVLCEGGGRLGSSLIRADRVDRLYVFRAPDLFGEDGVHAFPGPVSFRGRVVQNTQVGRDTLTVIDRADV